MPLFPSGAWFPVAIAIADFDMNGHADIAVPTGSDDSAAILFGTGDGAFAPAQLLTGLPGATAIGAADLDGDGDPELLVGFGGTTTPQLALFENTGNGTFAAPVLTDLASLGEFENIVFADLNNDTNLDVLVPGFPISILLNDGAGNLGAPVQVAGLSGNEIATGDVNNDGNADVLAGRFNSSTSIALGNGNGTFQLPIFLSDVFPNAAHLVDITGDGKRDLVYTSGSLSSGTLNVKVGNGDGTFGPATALNASNNSDLLLEDFDGDTRLDAIATGGTTGMTVFIGMPGGFSPGVEYSVPLSAFDAVLGYWDSDGETDVAVTD